MIRSQYFEDLMGFAFGCDLALLGAIVMCGAAIWLLWRKQK